MAFVIVLPMNIIKEYIRYPFMFKQDLKLKRAYFFVNPYRAVRKFLQKRGESNPHQYGETPIHVIKSLIDAAGGLKKYQYFADVGAGRGRISYFVQKVYGCKVFAYEQLGLFVKKGKKLFPKVQFIAGDFLKADLSKMDIIYFYGTMMKEKEILEFTCQVRKGCRVISISYPLTDYDSRFKVTNKVEITFPWGKTNGYIQQLR
ncbi:MAG: hypothetical protein SP4CHLAM5_01650 [Chlamydiia bacterium]|nr:hypothetical protein [Chlamydiia bacterium]MCH9618039.1 hypothetical protein [Chlamydiia bacterium]MCH9623636.1 hypothetical protein [Chlamydiia bacterium]